MKTKNFKIKNDLCDFYSPVKIAAAEAAPVVAVTTAETSCMLLQIERLREMIQRTDSLAPSGPVWMHAATEPWPPQARVLSGRLKTRAPEPLPVIRLFRRRAWPGC